MNKILIIIVTYNAMKWAEKCFSSLRKSSTPVDVFVVDNGSTDGTQEFIKKNYPDVYFYQSTSNLGFGKANNLGLQYAVDHQYEFVYLLNQDAWVFPETFSELIKISNAHSDYGILSPFQMEADLQHIDKRFIKSIFGSPNEGEIVSALYCNCDKDVYQVYGVMAAHWFITRDCLKKVGGFSPTFPHYGEDYNYIDRATFYGFKIGVVPSLKVVHDRGSRKETPEGRMYMGYIVSLHALSKPLKSKGFMFSIYMMFKNVCKYGSLKPLSYFLRLVSELPLIKRNRKTSILNECAFLNYNNK